MDKDKGSPKVKVSLVQLSLRLPLHNKFLKEDPLRASESHLEDLSGLLRVRVELVRVDLVKVDLAKELVMAEPVKVDQGKVEAPSNRGVVHLNPAVL